LWKLTPSNFIAKCSYVRILSYFCKKLCYMKEIISTLIGTQGIFIRALEGNKNSASYGLAGRTSADILYLSPANDRVNLRSDMRRFYADFGKAVSEAKKKVTA